MKFKKDGHIHTSFCPHGSKDRMEQYVKEAIHIGLREISFTEHAPLPMEFSDPAPTKDSSMNEEDIPAYLEEGKRLQHKYRQNIHISIGFEVDYIEGFHTETKDFLDSWGEQIDDAILSVHFLPAGDEYVCMDYSAGEFGRLVKTLGSVDHVHDLYYQTVEKSIKADLGIYKPKRIGHITLANKFKKKFPPENDFTPIQVHLLDLLKKEGLELDANTAGWYKPDCGESYPPLPLLELARKRGIPIIPGSDSHEAAHLARGFEKIYF